MNETILCLFIPQYFASVNMWKIHVLLSIVRGNSIYIILNIHIIFE